MDVNLTLNHVLEAEKSGMANVSRPITKGT